MNPVRMFLFAQMLKSLLVKLGIIFNMIKNSKRQVIK